MMNAAQIEYFIKRVDEEAERKREAINKKYISPEPILLRLDAAVFALKDFCILNGKDIDVYSYLKEFIGDEF